jgi:hypothetical protein
MEGSWLRIGVSDLTLAQEHPMTDAPVSPLGRRMIEDMTIRKFAPRTQEGYIRASQVGRRLKHHRLRLRLNPAICQVTAVTARE